jgi:hypothetical protein
MSSSNRRTGSGAEEASGRGSADEEAGGGWGLSFRVSQPDGARTGRTSNKASDRNEEAIIVNVSAPAVAESGG